MVQRLQDVLGQLYQPPVDGTRQVLAMSRSIAEKLPQLPTMAVISITAPDRPPASVGDFAYLLRLSFADVDFLNPDLSMRARGKLAHAFTEEHADAIRAFVEALPEEITSLVIHCEGGYSRSCGVAVALHQLHDYSMNHQHLASANPSIIRVMMGEARAPRMSKNFRR